eukprot:scaffold14557_cov67-Attheya_sp.AAC.4
MAFTTIVFLSVSWSLPRFLRFWTQSVRSCLGLLHFLAWRCLGFCKYFVCGMIRPGFTSPQKGVDGCLSLFICTVAFCFLHSLFDFVSIFEIRFNEGA